jgi:vacuolar protein sorting-associated protein 13A/C
MAKQLLLQVLKKKFGGIFDGLESDKLQVAVWSGNVVLEGLTIKKEALDDLALPLCIESGTIKAMNIKVPWSRLGSQPITVQIDGVKSEPSISREHGLHKWLTLTNFYSLFVPHSSRCHATCRRFQRRTDTSPATTPRRTGRQRHADDACSWRRARGRRCKGRQ